MARRSLSSCPSIVSVSKDHYYVNNKPFHLCRSQRCRQISVSSYSCVGPTTTANSETQADSRNDRPNQRDQQQQQANSECNNDIQHPNQQPSHQPYHQKTRCFPSRSYLYLLAIYVGILFLVFPTYRASYFRGLSLDSRYYYMLTTEMTKTTIHEARPVFGLCAERERIFNVEEGPRHIISYEVELVE